MNPAVGSSKGALNTTPLSSSGLCMATNAAIVPPYKIIPSYHMCMHVYRVLIDTHMHTRLLESIKILEIITI